ncbi:MFS transporter [Bradyrhizobium prioriisuperbiae]|uniref:MFS transporter n=1 Tax=Bradyrhizobium prioriisuperbiae TaxID=2854389 RepID=UPI0028E28EFB|nr:MFS transporter [Bradyrhizobium prioritasuperba]
MVDLSGSLCDCDERFLRFRYPSRNRSIAWIKRIQLGLVVAPAALVFVLTGPLWGRLNVRIGQKQTIVLSPIAAAASTIAFGLVIVLRLSDELSTTATFLGLVVGRMGLSLFAAAILPTAQAYIADTMAHEHRTAALAQMGAGFALGLVAAPGIAGATASLGPFIPSS